MLRHAPAFVNRTVDSLSASNHLSVLREDVFRVSPPIQEELRSPVHVFANIAVATDQWKQLTPPPELIRAVDEEISSKLSQLKSSLVSSAERVLHEKGMLPLRSYPTVVWPYSCRQLLQHPTSQQQRSTFAVLCAVEHQRHLLSVITASLNYQPHKQLVSTPPVELHPKLLRAAFDAVHTKQHTQTSAELLSVVLHEYAMQRPRFEAGLVLKLYQDELVTLPGDLLPTSELLTRIKRRGIGASGAMFRKLDHACDDKYGAVNATPLDPMERFAMIVIPQCTRRCESVMHIPLVASVPSQYLWPYLRWHTLSALLTDTSQQLLNELLLLCTTVSVDQQPNAEFIIRSLVAAIASEAFLERDGLFLTVRIPSPGNATANDSSTDEGSVSYMYRRVAVSDAVMCLLQRDAPAAHTQLYRALRELSKEHPSERRCQQAAQLPPYVSYLSAMTWPDEWIQLLGPGYSASLLSADMTALFPQQCARIEMAFVTVLTKVFHTPYRRLSAARAVQRFHRMATSFLTQVLRPMAAQLAPIVSASSDHHLTVQLAGWRNIAVFHEMCSAIDSTFISRSLPSWNNYPQSDGSDADFAGSFPMLAELVRLREFDIHAALTNAWNCCHTEYYDEVAQSKYSGLLDARTVATREAILRDIGAVAQLEPVPHLRDTIRQLRVRHHQEQLHQSVHDAVEDADEFEVFEVYQMQQIHELLRTASVLLGSAEAALNGSETTLWEARNAGEIVLEPADETLRRRYPSFFRYHDFVAKRLKHGATVTNAEVRDHFVMFTTVCESLLYAPLWKEKDPLAAAKSSLSLLRAVATPKLGALETATTAKQQQPSTEQRLLFMLRAPLCSLETLYRAASHFYGEVKNNLSSACSVQHLTVSNRSRNRPASDEVSIPRALANLSFAERSERMLHVFQAVFRHESYLDLTSYYDANVRVVCDRLESLQRATFDTAMLTIGDLMSSAPAGSTPVEGKVILYLQRVFAVSDE